MGMSAVQQYAQEERRREVASRYVARIPKGEIAKDLKVSKQTITRDVAWLIAKWNQELVKDPVAARARTLATMQELEAKAAQEYRMTGSGSWWDRWLLAVQSITRFLGLDAPIKVDAHLDGDVNFTVEFETPSGRIVDAESWSIMQLEEAEDELEEERND